MRDTGAADDQAVRAGRQFSSLFSELQGIVSGSGRVARFMLIALLSGNHILLEGVPGLAKTRLANAFSAKLGLHFRRIQFTPDMLPSDIMGSHVFNQANGSMEFRQGPVFTNVLLADEINRTPPKVQSALLEAMEERHVTSGGQTFQLPSPFIVIATENPVEYEGTFPLAEALLDRFLFRYRMSYPTRDEELRAMDIAFSQAQGGAVLGAEEILHASALAAKVRVGADVKGYILDIVRNSREMKQLRLGASPRTSVKFLSAVRANALISGRGYAIPDDVRYIAHEMLNHRLILRQEMLLQDGFDERGAVDALIAQLLDSTEPPR